MVEEQNPPSDGETTVDACKQDVINSVDARQEAPKRKHDWYDLTHLVVLVATFFAAMAAATFTGWMASRTSDLASNSNEELISATRAWVVPTGARLDGDVTLNKNLRIKILFENVGKEAAWDVVDRRAQGPLFDVIIDANQMPYIDVNTNPWPINTSCNVNPLQFSNRRTIYPSSINEDITYVFTGPSVSQDFVDKKKSFTVIGCLVYRTPIQPHKVRHSPYCFYFQPKREGTINAGTFEFCPSGSANAD